MKKVDIYTDGSCLGNPGPGGWAAILVLSGTAHRKEICGGFRLTTNNRMELTAAIESLGALREPCDVKLMTDSQYLYNAVKKKWLNAWEHGGWRKKTGKPLPNNDLWRKLRKFLSAHKVEIIWIKGHAGHAENERCDFLARNQAALPDLPADYGYEEAALNPDKL